MVAWVSLLVKAMRYITSSHVTQSYVTINYITLRYLHFGRFLAQDSAKHAWSEHIHN